jgi:hypothetical protein
MPGECQEKVGPLWAVSRSLECVACPFVPVEQSRAVVIGERVYAAEAMTRIGVDQDMQLRALDAIFSGKHLTAETVHDLLIALGVHRHLVMDVEVRPPSGQLAPCS